MPNMPRQQTLSMWRRCLVRQTFKFTVNRIIIVRLPAPPPSSTPLIHVASLQIDHGSQSISFVDLFPYFLVHLFISNPYAPHGFGY